MRPLTCLLINDELQQKAITNILAAQDVPYVVINPDGNIPLPDDVKKALVAANEVRIVIDQEQPTFSGQKPCVVSTIIDETNLLLLQAFVTSYASQMRRVLALTQNKVVKLITLTPKAANDPFRTLLNVFLHTYNEGLAMEVAPYQISVSLLYYDPNEPPVSLTNALLQAFNQPPSELLVNLPSAAIKAELPRYWPCAKNRLIKWNETSDHVALVTGASGGIGHAIATKLIAQGWRIYSLSRQAGVKDGIMFWECDLTNEAAVTKKFAQLCVQEPKLSLIVNNSGIGTAGSLEFEAANDLAAMYALNVVAPMRLMRLAQSILSQNAGSIVNIGSVGGFYTLPFQTSYSVTKALVNAYTQLLLPAFNDRGIRVLDLMPGDTKTSFSAHRKMNVHDEKQRYATRIQQSIAAMQRDEQNGHPPQKVADVLWKTLQMSPMPVRTSVGAYNLLVSARRFAPPKLVNWYLKKKYAKS